jgi:Spirocyclase AveC-like
MPPVEKQSAMTWAWTLIGVGVLGVIAHYARMGAVSPRIANPEVTGVPRSVEFLLGWRDHRWLVIQEWGTVVVMIAIIVGCAHAWRRQPGHPYVLMTIASTAIVWQDPIMNWAPYAVYNPQLWHWPEDWPLVKMSPTVEPFIVIGYALFYFGPFFPAMAVLRRLQARASMDAFVWRHPLISLGALVLVIGFFFDAFLEISLVRTGLYIYSQVIPWGSLFTGTTFQFPFIWESSFVCLVMVPAAVLCYRDDTGRSQAEKLARRFRWLPSHPALGTFLVMFAIVNVAYFMYGGAGDRGRVSLSVPGGQGLRSAGLLRARGGPGPISRGFLEHLGDGPARRTSDDQ